MTDMNLTAPTFDIDNARTCADASARAYLQSSVANDTTDTRCLVIESTDAVIIAFRGTNSIRNWITDADFRRNILELKTGAEVHDGFLRAFDSIIQALTDRLKRIVVGTRKVFVTGHSLGGALAILCALELKRQGFAIAQVYTFGQPRVGNLAFKTLYEAALGEKTFRVVYQEDIVPRLPHLAILDTKWKLGKVTLAVVRVQLTDPYRHCGTEVFISSLTPGDLWFDPPIWRLLVSDAWGLYRAFIVSKCAGALDPIHDHYVRNYVGSLNNPTITLTNPPMRMTT